MDTVQKLIDAAARQTATAAESDPDSFYSCAQIARLENESGWTLGVNRGRHNSVFFSGRDLVQVIRRAEALLDRRLRPVAPRPHHHNGEGRKGADARQRDGDWNDSYCGC